MRSLILLLALASPAFAQTPVPISIPTKAEWVGPLEFEDDFAKTIYPTKVSLTFGADGTVAGEWTAGPMGASGTITGTIDKKSQMTLTVQFFSGAQVNDVLTDVERCHGEGRFTGTITRTGVIRWTARTMTFDTPLKRLQDRDCGDLSRLIWTLQLHGD